MIMEESDIHDWGAFQEKIGKLYECRQISLVERLISEPLAPFLATVIRF
jgi:hypothetical protein